MMEGVTLTKLPKSQVACDVTVPYDEVATGLHAAAAALSARNPIKGFRAGKVPYDVLKQHIGAARIFEEAAYAVIEKKYRAIVEANDLRTVGQPKIEITKLADGNPLSFRMTVAVIPDITLPDYRTIAAEVHKERQPAVVSDADLADTLSWIRKSRRKEALVARPAAQGDMVLTDFEIRSGGVKIEGGDSKNHPVILGERRFMNGFEDALIGATAGDERSFSLTAPEDYQNKGLRGRPLDFSVTVRGVYELELPPLDDAFAQSLGKFENLAALTENIRTGLRAEKKKESDEAARKTLSERIALTVGVDIPDMLVDQEVEKMMRELVQSVEGQGLTFTDYCVHIKKTSDDLAKDFRPQAEVRVKIALALAAIARTEGIAAGDDEVKERAEKFLAHRTNKEVVGIDRAVLSRYVANIIQNEKVFALLLAEKP
ncbi:MAG: trigger factor [Patescibacteria group bacterium]